MNRYTETAESSVDLTPMLDVVFILLIFFIITASFARETGIVIDHPEKAVPKPNEDNNSLVFRIDSNRQIWFQQRAVDVRAVRALIQSEQSKNDATAVLICTHKSAPADLYTSIADAARSANITNVSLSVIDEQ